MSVRPRQVEQLAPSLGPTDTGVLHLVLSQCCFGDPGARGSAAGHSARSEAAVAVRSRVGNLWSLAARMSFPVRDDVNRSPGCHGAPGPADRQGAHGPHSHRSERSFSG